MNIGNLCQNSSRKLLVGWVRRTDPGCSSFSMAGTNVLDFTILLFLHISERYRGHQCYVSGTPGTGTFCISGTITGMHSGSGTGFGFRSNSGTGTGFGSGSSIKWEKSQKINNVRPPLWKTNVATNIEKARFCTFFKTVLDIFWSLNRSRNNWNWNPNFSKVGTGNTISGQFHNTDDHVFIL